MIKNYCPQCIDPPPFVGKTGFGWKAANTCKDNEYVKYLPALEFQERLKSNKLFKCKNCKSYWLLDDRENGISFIPKDREDILFKWAKTNLKPSKEQLEPRKTRKPRNPREMREETPTPGW